MKGKSLQHFPIHLGRRGRASSEPQFTGFDWFEAYGARHRDDEGEGRLVTLLRFEEPWTSWEIHPLGDEIVCCLEGEMVLHQELGDGRLESFELGPGDYAINPKGTWHTADASGPALALFITAGEGTCNRPR